MFDVVVTEKDFEDITKFINGGKLVLLMNESGLSFGAMALILQGIQNEMDKVKESKENN